MAQTAYWSLTTQIRIAPGDVRIYRLPTMMAGVFHLFASRVQLPAPVISPVVRSVPSPPGLTSVQADVAGGAPVEGEPFIAQPEGLILDLFRGDELMSSGANALPLYTNSSDGDDTWRVRITLAPGSPVETYAFDISLNPFPSTLQLLTRRIPLALTDRSRRPYRHANQRPIQIETWIVRLKQDYPGWGAPKIRERLRRQYPGLQCPAISTVHAVLDRHGLVTRRKRRRYRAAGTTRSRPTQPNDLWCADDKIRVHAGQPAGLLSAHRSRTLPAGTCSRVRRSRPRKNAMPSPCLSGRSKSSGCRSPSGPTMECRFPQPMRSTD